MSPHPPTTARHHVPAKQGLLLRPPARQRGVNLQPNRYGFFLALTREVGAEVGQHV